MKFLLLALLAGTCTGLKTALITEAIRGIGYECTEKLNECRTWATLTLVLGATLAPIDCTAATQYDSYANSYNKLDGGDAAEILGLNKMRATAGKEVRGDVLEVALGTGLQLDFLDPRAIKSLTGIDYSSGMLEEAKNKLEAASPGRSFSQVNLEQMDASAMDEFAEDSFDTVQSTFSFCVFDEPEKVMREMKRVVRPNGKVVLLENSRSILGPLAAIQDLTEPIVTPLSKNCRWNVNVPKLAKEAGLKLEKSDTAQAGTIFYGVYSK